MKNNPIISQTIADQMFKDKKVRIGVTKESHLFFFHFYFAHYVAYPTAPFQKEIFALTENEKLGNFFIVAFRGSGKSTIVTTSYPLWAVLGKQQKKYVLLLFQTVNQAKQHMRNLKQELENNTLLKSDLGPFKEESDEWGSLSLVFSLHGARISVASSEQSIRGVRHNQHRPDLIICDDVEDMASVKTRESREKTRQWLTGEVIPAGDRNTRLVIVGNLLHEDSLLMKIKSDIKSGKRSGVFKEYPLINAANDILWQGKYPGHTAIEEEKMRTANEIAWQREYLLRIIPDDDQVVYPEWISHYEKLPQNDSQFRDLIIGVDLAISQENTADYTAIISAVIYGDGESYRVYILPNLVNERLTFPQTIERLKIIYESFDTSYLPKICVEDVGYQRAVIQQLENMGYSVEGIKVSCDKRSRLTTVTHLIQQGKILFPAKGAERLISQLLGFGVEKHDDLVDAFTIVGHQAIKLNTPISQLYWI